jgi:hypothetical protein
MSEVVDLSGPIPLTVRRQIASALAKLGPELVEHGERAFADELARGDSSRGFLARALDARASWSTRSMGADQHQLLCEAAHDAGLSSNETNAVMYAFDNEPALLSEVIDRYLDGRPGGRPRPSPAVPRTTGITGREAL